WHYLDLSSLKRCSLMLRPSWNGFLSPRREGGEFLFFEKIGVYAQNQRKPLPCCNDLRKEHLYGNACKCDYSMRGNEDKYLRSYKDVVLDTLLAASTGSNC